MDLLDRLNLVKDEATFLAFVKALAKDREEAAVKEMKNPSSPYGPDAGGWENATIDAFLESAVAWAEDSSFGEAQGLKGASPWKKLAVFLHCGKTYE